MKLNEDWEQEARNWIAWARRPGHDSYWQFSPLFLDLVPAPRRLTVELGCGEGRVCRDLAARGHRVVGIDASPTLLRAARDAGDAGDYVLADAAVLPFADRSFDLAVAYNSLMDFHDMPGAVAEAARVLQQGAPFCICITHPLADAGSFSERRADAPFVISGSYLGRRRLEVTVARAGLEMTFRGWAYGLEDYARALEAAGFLIEALREPAVPAEEVVADPAEGRWARIPNFLFLRAVRS
jgi:SAM-dependent methyltransferase